MRRLLGLVALAACTPAQLTFRATNGGAKVAETAVLPGLVWTPTDADLGPALERCLDELTASLDLGKLAGSRLTTEPSTELALYSRDPGEMTTFLASLSDGEINAALASFPTSDHASWHPKTAVPSGFPRVAIATTPGGVVVDRVLSTTELWGPRFATGLPASLTMCHPGGDPGRLQPGASLESASLVNRGVCQREMPLAQFLADGNAQLVDALHSKRHLGIGSVKVVYSILQSFIEPTGAGLSEPVSGVFLFLHYVARDLAGNAPSDVRGAVRFDFGIGPNGRVELRPRELRWDYGGAWGPLSSNGAVGQPGWHDAITKPDGQMVATVNQTILRKQLLGVQNPSAGAILSGFACNERTFEDVCGRAASTLADVIEAKLPAGKFTPAETRRLLCAIGDPESCVALGADPKAALRRQWICTQAVTDHPTCDLVVPARRLVALPDSLGVVFFSDDDLDNAAYTLQAASGSLCESPAAPTTRSFTASVLRD